MKLNSFSGFLFVWRRSRQGARFLSLVVSNRITGWRAEDEGLMARLFPEAARPVDKDDPWKVLSKPVAVVQMAPLHSGQVKQFAAARSNRADDFIAAITARDLWVLAGRPLDVEGLLSYWERHGDLGTLGDLVEYDVERKLVETNPRRAKDASAPLRPLRAREGAERSAAATVLGRALTFTLDPDGRPTDALTPTGFWMTGRRSRSRRSSPGLCSTRPRISASVSTTARWRSIWLHAG